MNPFLPDLRKAENMHELAIIWRVIASLSKVYPSTQWEEAKEAFRTRCQELGMEWKA